jgi:hypothetical protein
MSAKRHPWPVQFGVVDVGHECQPDRAVPSRGHVLTRDHLALPEAALATQ